jgi:hypothetical protein
MKRSLSLDGAGDEEDLQSVEQKQRCDANYFMCFGPEYRMRTMSVFESEFIVNVMKTDEFTHDLLSHVVVCCYAPDCEHTGKSSVVKFPVSLDQSHQEWLTHGVELVPSSWLPLVQVSNFLLLSPALLTRDLTKAIPHLDSLPLPSVEELWDLWQSFKALHIALPPNKLRYVWPGPISHDFTQHPLSTEWLMFGVHCMPEAFLAPVALSLVDASTVLQLPEAVLTLVSTTKKVVVAGGAALRLLCSASCQVYEDLPEYKCLPSSDVDIFLLHHDDEAKALSVLNGFLHVLNANGYLNCSSRASVVTCLHPSMATVQLIGTKARDVRNLLEEFDVGTVQCVYDGHHVTHTLAAAYDVCTGVVRPLTKIIRAPHFVQPSLGMIDAKVVSIPVAARRLQKMKLKGFGLQPREQNLLDVSVVHDEEDIAWGFPVLLQNAPVARRDVVLKKFGLLPLLSLPTVPLDPVPTYATSRFCEFRASSKEDWELLASTIQLTWRTGLNDVEVFFLESAGMFTFSGVSMPLYFTPSEYNHNCLETRLKEKICLATDKDLQTVVELSKALHVRVIENNTSEEKIPASLIRDSGFRDVDVVFSTKTVWKNCGVVPDAQAKLDLLANFNNRFVVTLKPSYLRRYHLMGASRGFELVFDVVTICA